MLLPRGRIANTVLGPAVVHTERGRYDTQAVMKTNVIFAGPFEAETFIFDQAGTYLPGTELMVDDVNIGGIVRRGLKAGAGGKAVVGYVTKLQGSGSSIRLRFQSCKYIK